MVKKLGFIVMLFFFSLTNIAGFFIENALTVQLHVSGQLADMRSADPAVQRFLRFGQSDYFQANVTYAFEGKQVTVPGLRLRKEYAGRLARGEPIKVNFLPDDPKVVEFVEDPREITWRFLVMGLLTLPLAIFAAFLYARERRRPV